MDILIVGVAVVLGISFGWWVKGLQYLRERRILEELYMRKVKLAESERADALRELNQKIAQTRDWQARIEDHAAEREVLDAELLAARNRASALEKDAARLVDALAEAEEAARGLGPATDELARRGAAVQEAAALALALDERLDGASGWSAELQARLSEREGELERLSAELRAASERLDEAERSHAEHLRRAELAAKRSEEALAGGWEQKHAAALEAARHEREAAHAAALTARDEREERLRAEHERAAGEAAAEHDEHARWLAAAREEASLARAELDDVRARLASLERERDETVAVLESQLAEHESLPGALREAEARAQAAEERIAEVERARGELETRAEELGREAARLEEVEAALAGEREAREELERALDRHGAASDEAAERIAAAESERDALRRDLERTRKAMEGAAARQEARLAKAEERIAALRSRADDARRQAAERKKQLAAVSGSHKRKQLELDRAAKRAAAAEKALAAREEQLAALDRELAGARAERRAAPANGRANGNGAAHGRDDLKVIAGIGPALEKRLRRLGYGSFAKLAGLDRETMESLAPKLGTTPQRIRREWLPAARREARKRG